MNSGESHLVAAVPAREIFPIGRLRRKVSRKLRDRDILFPRQKRRIGKRPDKFRAGVSADRIPDLAGIGLQRQDRPLGRGLGTGIDLSLVFRKIARNMIVIRKRMRCMRHRGILIHTQSLFFQAEFSLQETLSNLRRFNMEHGRSSLSISGLTFLPFFPIMPEHLSRRHRQGEFRIIFPSARKPRCREPDDCRRQNHVFFR